MTNDTRIWVCPAMCGCELSLTATWVKEQPDDDGTGRRVSFHHPVGRTITRVLIVAACPAHDSLRSDPLPADPYQGRPGYLPVPETPTEAERLYIQLYRYSGGRLRLDTCGCSVHQFVDRFDAQAAPTPKPHPRDTRKCPAHGADDVAHSNAFADNRRKNEVVGALMGRGLNADDIAWAFDAQRVLRVSARGLAASEKGLLTAQLAASHGAGKVVIE